MAVYAHVRRKEKNACLEKEKQVKQWAKEKQSKGWDKCIPYILLRTAPVFP